MKKIVTAALAMCIALAASAEGYQVNTLSTRQLGMGHTGVALKLGAESMFFNPAGMAFSDKTIDVSASVTGIAPTATATLPDGSEWSTHNPVSTPLDFSASFRVYDCLQAGVTFYTPYGSSIDWRDNWPGAVLNQRCDLRAFTVQPTLSWRITPRLSVGAGLMVTWGSVNLDKGLVSASSMDAMLAGLAATGAGAAMGIPADYRFGTTTPASVNLNGTTKLAFGFNVGAQPHRGRLFPVKNENDDGCRSSFRALCQRPRFRFAPAHARHYKPEQFRSFDAVPLCACFRPRLQTGRTMDAGS